MIGNNGPNFPANINIYLIISQIVNSTGAAKINRYIDQYYFERFLKVPIDLDILDEPHLLYNMDEMQNLHLPF